MPSIGFPQPEHFELVRVFAPPFSPFSIETNCLHEPGLDVALDAHMTIHDALLMMLLIAGTGLAAAYLRAEYVLHRGLKAAEHKKFIVQHELHANRLRPNEMDEPVAALRNHQPLISKESAIRVDLAPADLASTVYSRESADAGIARLRELA
jgi:hypothetical protein